MKRACFSALFCVLVCSHSFTEDIKSMKGFAIEDFEKEITGLWTVGNWENSYPLYKLFGIKERPRGYEFCMNYLPKEKRAEIQYLFDDKIYSVNLKSVTLRNAKEKSLNTGKEIEKVELEYMWEYKGRTEKVFFVFNKKEFVFGNLFRQVYENPSLEIRCYKNPENVTQGAFQDFKPDLKSLVDYMKEKQIFLEKNKKEYEWQEEMRKKKEKEKEKFLEELEKKNK